MRSPAVHIVNARTTTHEDRSTQITFSFTLFHNSRTFMSTKRHQDMPAGCHRPCSLRPAAGSLLHEVLAIEGAVHAQVVIQVEKREARAWGRRGRNAARIGDFGTC